MLTRPAFSWKARPSGRACSAPPVRVGIAEAVTEFPDLARSSIHADQDNVTWIFLLFLMQDGLMQNSAPRDARGQAERVRALMAPSLEKQRISVLQQARDQVESARSEAQESAGSFFATARLAMPSPFAMPTPFSMPDCDPVPKPRLFEMIQAAAEHQGVDPALVREVARQESAFRPCAVSNKGAEGLMQLMPATQAQFDVTDPFDPGQSLDAGAKLLKQLLDRYHGDLTLALSAYNSGASRVDKAGGIPDIPETKNYVFSILNRFLQ
jgi:soluble lytic murein transglycosylase-like protein